MALEIGGGKKTIALAGNPNVGKSTVFNALTGMNQHTGNWPGKTVATASGDYIYRDKMFHLVDIPGTYSLLAHSAEEEVARDFICFGRPDATVVVMDATCLERNLNLVLQILEITPRVIVCVNLLDEAKKKKIEVDLQALADCLQVPVVGAAARSKEGLDHLMEAIFRMTEQETNAAREPFAYPMAIEEAIALLQPAIEEKAQGKIDARWLALKALDDDASLRHSIDQFFGYDFFAQPEIAEKRAEAKKYLAREGLYGEKLRDAVVGQLVEHAAEIYQKCVHLGNAAYLQRDRKIDRILTSKKTGIPIMLLLLAGIFWLTITGANYPSALLSSFLFGLGDHLSAFMSFLGAPNWLHDVLIDGMYRTLAWVVAVMLPPMAIFFPLFTLLEDAGYLPRVAFNMDRLFRKANAHGKQALTTCMGFGCNACAIVGCRIIDSPRERLIAMLTNNFVPCNGRFPSLITISALFFAGAAVGLWRSVISTAMLTGIILFGIVLTLLVAKFLSHTILKGVPSSFALELPPYRRPQIGKVIIRSIFDRTLFVLGRAVMVAAPAGILIWVLANTMLGEYSILHHITNFLDPFARLMGLDGVILVAFLLGFPANEIVIPIMIMTYLSGGTLMELESLTSLHTLLIDHGWNLVTAICFMLFCLVHFPCGTTCLTIRKESGSWKWTFFAFAIPTILGILLCMTVNGIASFFTFLC